MTSGPKVPTAEEVAAMTSDERGDVRARFRRHGIPLPSYLVPRVYTRPTVVTVDEKEQRELTVADRVHLAAQQQREAELRRRGYPKTLRCLRCDRPRTARAPDDRMHAGDCNGGAIAFTSAEHRRISAYLNKHEPKAKPGPKPKLPKPAHEKSAPPKPALPKPVPVPKPPKVARPIGRPRTPLPTEAEVMALTIERRAALRRRYKVRGVSLPTYLAPMSKSEVGKLGGVAGTRSRWAA